MLADEQVEVGVVGEPVALVRRAHHVLGADARRVLAPGVAGHVREEEVVLGRVPDRPLGEREPGRDLLDRGALLDELVDRVRLRVDTHVASPFVTMSRRQYRPRAEPRSSRTGARSRLRGVHDATPSSSSPPGTRRRACPAVLDELRTGLPEADVLVIDDGSTDGTAELAAALGAIVVSFGENRGLRAGIAAGYREAAERGYAYCGRVDADGQHPVDELRACSRSSARTRATSRSARASPRATATTPTATGRRRPGASGSGSCRRRCTSASGRRSTTRRAGWPPSTGAPCP